MRRPSPQGLQGLQGLQASQLCVRVLGPLEVQVDGRPVVVAGARLRALLVRLALGAPHAVGPAALAGALWADPPGDVANALQTLVSRLRRALGSPGAVVSTPGGYRLVAAPDDVDALLFERLVRTAGPDRRGALQQALDLWRGPALEDVEASFAAAEAQSLEAARLTALEDALGHDLAAAPAAVLARVEPLAAAHPLRERTQALLVRALAATGRTADALTAYERLRYRLADELGVDPSPELAALHLRLLTASPLDAPARPDEAPLTSFVGREDDVAAVAASLRRGRLVTVVGPGGAGKTRLAVQVTRGSPAHVVELAPHGPSGVVRAVGDAIGLRDRTLLERVGPAVRAGADGEDDVLDRVAASLSQEPAPVLVLDNCEHVVDVAARVAERLLAAAPGLRVLATSREALRVGGEVLHPLGPLPLPDPGADAATAAGYPAVRLFTDRAAAVRPGFVLDDGDVAAVVEICRRLDGLPLAIELAAARLRALSPQAVAARLDDRFALLTAGSRTAMPRHRTLRAVVAWSWDLLDDGERALADAFGAVAGSADEALLAALRPDVRDVGGVLLDLVDKSLLQVVEARDGSPPRFRMLETLREYAAERLRDSGERDAALDRMARHLVVLAEDAEPRLRTADQLRWLALLTAEQPNLSAALDHLARRGEADLALRLVGALVWFWTLRGLNAESLEWLDRALDVPGEADPFHRAVARFARAVARVDTQGWPSPPDPVVLADLALLQEQVDRHPVLALAEPILILFTGDHEAARAVVHRRLAAATGWTRASLLLVEVLLCENLGDMAAVRALLPEPLALFTAIGDRWGLAACLTLQANVLTYDGRLAEALAATRAARDAAGALSARDDAVLLSLRAAQLRARLGDVAGALAEVQALHGGRVDGVEVPAGTGTAMVLLTLADLLALAGDPLAAHEHALAALEVAERVPNVVVQVVAHVCARLATLDLALGRPGEAGGRLDHPAVHRVVTFDMPVAARIATTCAALALDRDPGRAAALAGAADVLRGAQDPTDPDGAALHAGLAAALGERYDPLLAAAREVSLAAARALLLEALGLPAGQDAALRR